MAAATNASATMTYLDMQAAMGVTKHLGGPTATDKLLALCHVEDAGEVLNVGCGIGAGSAYIARRYPCRVVGVDLSEKMVEWSRLRARQEGIEERSEFRVADVLDLPFENGRFDVCLCESVLAFVVDKPRAVREMARVTRAGGYIGLNESLWLQPPPAATASRDQQFGSHIISAMEWAEIWEASGLKDRVMRTYPLSAHEEVVGRIRWIGGRWMLRAWGRFLRMYLQNPALRQFMKSSMDTPWELIHCMGYGLFAGRVPGEVGDRQPTTYMGISSSMARASVA